MSAGRGWECGISDRYYNEIGRSLLPYVGGFKTSSCRRVWGRCVSTGDIDVCFWDGRSCCGVCGRCVGFVIFAVFVEVGLGDKYMHECMF